MSERRSAALPRSRGLAPVAALLLLLAPGAAGCPDALSQLCPANTTQQGLFSATLTPRSGVAGECRVVSDGDGGPLDASLATTPQPFSAALCTSFDSSDGGPLIWLALPNVVRPSPLGDGGTFLWGTDTVVIGTACGCDITVSERIAGAVQPSQPDAAVVLAPDGTLPSLGGFQAMIRDAIDRSDAATAACLCNLPCGLTYDLVATRQ